MTTTGHTALYRKYRPQTFDEVIGQEHVTVPLIQALRNGKLNHAYLFSGPRGCGKTSSARILARSLNCAEGPTPEPCGKCESCLALAPDGSGSLDVIEIDAASHGGVDDARELRERAFFAPVNSRFKVYVIDEAHMVSSAGFNALLKLVEEPPEFVKFVFATTEPDKVLQTIRSRTHHYPFRLIPPGTLRAYLEQLCERENVLVEPSVLPLVVRAGGGSARDSLSILDQLLAGAGPEGVTYQRAVALLGVTDGALLDGMCDALAASDGAAVFGVVDRVVEAGHDPRRFAADLLERLRDLLIVEKVPDAVGKGIIDAPADQLERMTGQALRLGGASLSRMADIVHDGLVQMRGTTSPRLLLELVCARMLLPAGDEGQAALAQRLERLERRFEISGAVASDAASEAVPATLSGSYTHDTSARPAEPPVVAASPAPVADAPSPGPSSMEAAGHDASAVSRRAGEATTGHARGVEPAATASPQVPAAVRPSGATPTGADLGIDDVRRLWPDVLEKLKRRRVVWALMQNATPVALAGQELVLGVQHQGLVPRFSDDTVIISLKDALFELVGVRWTVRAEARNAAGAPVAFGSPVPEEPDEEWPQVRAVGSDAGGVPVAPPPVAPSPAPPPPQIDLDHEDMETSHTVDDKETSGFVDTEAAALSLLQRQLGARPIGERENR